MGKVLFPGHDVSPQQSSASPPVGNGNGRNRLQKRQPPPSAVAPKSPFQMPSVTPSEPNTTASNSVAKQQTPYAPIKPDFPPCTTQKSARYHSESQASTERSRAAVGPTVTARDTQVLPSLSTRQMQKSASTSSSSGQTSSTLTNRLAKAIPSFKNDQQDPFFVISGPPAGHSESEMILPALSSPSQLRKRYSTTFSSHCSTHSGIPKSSISRQPPDAAFSKLPSCHSPLSRPPSASSAPVSSSSVSPPRTATTSQSPPSPRSSASTSTSSSSLRMLLFKHKKPQAVTFKGQEISGPFPQRDVRPMGQAPGLGEDGSVSMDLWRDPPYQAIRAATPPTPVRSLHAHQTEGLGSSQMGDDSISRSNIGMKHGVGVIESSKQSLYQSDSLQSRATARSAAVKADKAFPMDQKLMKGTISSTPTSTYWSSVMSPPQSPALSRPPALKKSDRSWSSRLVSKSKSVFSARQSVANTSSALPQGLPQRPPRPEESIRREVHEHPSLLSIVTSPEAISRIDSYGWHNIKPLPGRGRLTPEVADVPRASDSSSSGSVYSVPSENGRQAKPSDDSSKARISKHRRVAFWPLDGETRRRQMMSVASVSSPGSTQVVDRKGKTPLQSTEGKAQPSTTTNGANFRTKSKLTAVTEEEAELDCYDKPLPAPPTTSTESSDAGTMKRRKSAAILLQGEYKPWWEEQNIPETELDIEVNVEHNQTPESSLEVQASSTLHSPPSTSVHPDTANEEASEGHKSMELPSKSMLLTEIARSYVDEQQRTEDRERQERYRKQMRGARLGNQMVPPSPQPKQEKFSRGGKGKWRFSVFENEVDSRPSTPDDSNSSDGRVSGRRVVAEARITKVGKSASASTLTLPESEKAKLRPLPLRVPSTRDEQSTAKNGSIASLLTNEAQTGMRKAGKRPNALSLPNTMAPSRSDIRRAATALSEKTGSPSPGSLIRRNGEVLLPSDDLCISRSPISPPSSSSSSRFWSDSQHDEGRQPNTPPTGGSVGPETRDTDAALRHRMTNEIDIKRDTSATENEIGSDSDILDFYLDTSRSARAPPVPRKSPRRISPTQNQGDTVEIALEAERRKKKRTDGKFKREKREIEARDEDDDQRRCEEDEESRRRVVRILAVLREKSVLPSSVLVRRWGR